MLQNIIAYSVILGVFGLSGYYLYKKETTKAIICLIIGGWVTNVGMAYHVRTMNEAKENMEILCVGNHGY